MVEPQGTGDPAALDIPAAADRLAERARRIGGSSTTADLLLELRSAQSALVEIYETLARRRKDIAQHAPHGAERNAAADAEVALREAAQYGADAESALERARRADEFEEWVEEVDTDR